MFDGTVPLSEEEIGEEETFTLAVGEACKVRQEYVDKLNEGARFKMLWTRVDDRSYRWRASDGDVGTVFGDSDVGLVKFSTQHWEKT